jgi:hypothetical protein
VKTQPTEIDCQAVQLFTPAPGMHVAYSLRGSVEWGRCIMTEAIGARRIITYTLTSEGGASLRGAGWSCDGETGKSFWGNANTRAPAVHREHFDVPKCRWSKTFRDAVAYEIPGPEQPESGGNLTLF